MTLRNASGKFSLPFGRKPDGAPVSPSSRQASGTYGTGDDSDPSSPTGAGFGSGGGGGGLNTAAFDGLGKKIGKSIAHTSLLPALGNKDLRALQDVIAAEKGMLQATEKLGTETATVAAKLPVYGSSEGPDLQDVLTHSSTLLSHLSTALHVFAGHQASLRLALKRARAREEELDELRRRRRATGQKAETAEKKLAKMGPENKGLVQQTELLERLRAEMRSMDSDIVTEESKLGDFKRQTIKEALSFKFGGLEELGEKMCIIGELGKLLLEEIPLEETPPGYGRAPYTAYERTENTVNEATKCLATVHFSAGSSAPKPPALPDFGAHGALRTPELPRHSRSISEAEQFANYPTDAASPPTTGPATAATFPLDANPYAAEDNGGAGSGAGAVVWQHDDEHAGDGGPSYEYEQQREIDAAHAREEAAWRAGALPAGAAAPTGLAPAVDIHAAEVVDPSLAAEHSIGGPAGPAGAGAAGSGAPWEPLNVRRTPEPPASVSLHDGPAPPAPEPRAVYVPPAPAPVALAPPVAQSDAHDAYDAYDAIEDAPATDDAHHAASIPLPPPTPVEPPTPGVDGFYTPAAELSPVSTPTMVASAAAAFPLPVGAVGAVGSGFSVGPGAPAAGNGKISAAAFRRGVKPRTSVESGSGEFAPPPALAGDRPASPALSAGSGHQIRRLPVPPLERDGAASPAPAPAPAAHAAPAEPGQDEPPAYVDEGLR